MVEGTSNSIEIFSKNGLEKENGEAVDDDKKCIGCNLRSNHVFTGDGIHRI